MAAGKTDNHRLRRIRIALFALVWFSCAWFGSWEFNPNNAVRLWAAVSLVEDGDATIDEYAHLTVDKAVFAGRTYSDKAPGMTLTALPAVWLADRVTGDRAANADKWFGDPRLVRFTRLRLRLAAATTSAVLTAIAAVLLFDLGMALTGSAPAGLFGAIGYALGTPAWGWSTTILGHAPVAALFVIAVWLAWRLGEGRPRKPSSQRKLGTSRKGPSFRWGDGVHAALLGLTLGWAVVVEHQAVLAGAVIGGWALLRYRSRPDRWPLLAAAVAGGLIALLPFVAYNMVAFGTPLRVGYSGVVGWSGMNRGLFGLTWSQPFVVWAITLGPKVGLVWVAPILILAALGVAGLAGRRDTRGLAVAVTLTSLTVLLVNAAYVYWQGGNTTGPRLAVPLIGVLSIGLAPWYAAFRNTAARALSLGVLAASIAINAAIASADIFAPQGMDWPVWRWVIRQQFLAGQLRTMPSEWFDWTPWHGFALWAAVALPLLAWLAWAATHAYPAAARVTGASVGHHGEARA